MIEKNIPQIDKNDDISRLSENLDKDLEEIWNDQAAVWEILENDWDLVAELWMNQSFHESWQQAPSIPPKQREWPPAPDAKWPRRRGGVLDSVGPGKRSWVTVEEAPTAWQSIRW